MEEILKKLLENISPRTTREILEDHVKEITVDDDNKSVTIEIDRTYALNQLSSSDHIWSIIKWIKKSFWEEYETILKNLDHSVWRYWNEHHDREMNIPHFIHYR